MLPPKREVAMIERPGGPHADPLPGMRASMARFGTALTQPEQPGRIARRRMVVWTVLALLIVNALVLAVIPEDGSTVTFGPVILGLPLVAIGGVATGWIAIGGLAVGVVAIGGLAVGAIVAGGLALGLVLAVGGGAVGYYANGGLAVGGYAYAGNGVAFGRFQAQGNQHEALIGR
jgi:hypothetical protein